MRVDPRAGKPAAPSMLVNVPQLMTAYYTLRPDVSVSGQRVAFGTSGHRGSALDVSFNEHHILAITQAICDYRRHHAMRGPLFLGADTHALSNSAWSRLTNAPGNGAPIGGLKVVTENGWFAARPSGTEDIYKLYAESFTGSDHLSRIQEEAQAIIRRVLRAGGRN